MNLKRYLCMRLKEQLPIEIHDKSIDKFAEDFQEIRVTEVLDDVFFTCKVINKQSLKITHYKFSEYLKSLIEIKRF